MLVKQYYTPDLIKEKQKARAEIAALVAVRCWMDKQAVTKPVEHKTTSWKRRLA
jgi:hypothetical protein